MKIQIDTFYISTSSSCSFAGYQFFYFHVEDRWKLLFLFIDHIFE